MFTQIKFEVTAGLYNDFFNFLIENEYIITNIRHTQFGFTASCGAKDYKKIARQAKRFQCRTKVIEKSGLYFKIRSYTKRKGLLVGIICFLALSYIFTLFIWKIDIKTENSAIKNDISAILYNQEIYVGQPYSKEKLQKATQEIFIKNEDIAYVALNFYKGILTCEVDERDKKESYINTERSTDIIANESGVITTLRVYSGFSQISLGQSVAKGDVLVSGLTFNSKNQPIQATPAAYIEAYCEKTYEVFVPWEKEQLVYTGAEREALNLKIAFKSYSIKKANIDSWAEYTQLTQVSSGEFFGFRLPFTLEKITYYQRTLTNISLNDIQGENIAKTQLQKIVEQDVLLVSENRRSYTFTPNQEGIYAKCVVEGQYNIAG